MNKSFFKYKLMVMAPSKLEHLWDSRLVLSLRPCTIIYPDGVNQRQVELNIAFVFLGFGVSYRQTWDTGALIND